VFLENLVAHERLVLKSVQGVKYPEWEIEEDSEDYLAKKKLTDNNIRFFKEACEKRSVGCTIHRDSGFPAKEVLIESRFADILVIDAATSFNKRYEGMPTDFVKNILKNAECPVIIAPESFDGIDEIIFTYNGSESSVFAIKQFTYLLPQLNNKKITIVQVNENGEWADEDRANFKEWLQDHYPSIHFEALKGDTNSELLGYLLTRKNVFIVMGAYGRTSVSNFFKHSRADILIKTISQPIFISHY
ncbi:MAG: hypothetical protein ACHQFX_04165, partial [Chitinophagales bacterium]